MIQTDAARPYTLLRIVVVDDEDLVRLPVVAMLQEGGADIFEFSTAADALRALATLTDIDLVLTDVNMPGMDGVAFAGALAALKPGLPVIFMSGQARPPSSGHFIAKPFGYAALQRVVQEAIDTGRAPSAP